MGTSIIISTPKDDLRWEGGRGVKSKTMEHLYLVHYVLALFCKKGNSGHYFCHKAIQTVKGHFNPGLFNPKLQPRTFRPRTFQPHTFQSWTVQPWIFQSQPFQSQSQKELFNPGHFMVEKSGVEKFILALGLRCPATLIRTFYEESKCYSKVTNSNIEFKLMLISIGEQ